MYKSLLDYIVANFDKEHGSMDVKKGILMYANNFDEVLKTLEPLEDKAIRLLFGIDTDERMTYQEIAEELNISESSLREILTRTNEKLDSPDRIEILRHGVK